MDIVKVDVDKLQLLNDRISQTLEALTQVRATVHGLQHSSSPQGFPIGAAGYAGTNPFLGATPYDINPGAAPLAGQQYRAGFAPTGVPSISHTSAPMAFGPWADAAWAARCQTFPYLMSQAPRV